MVEFESVSVCKFEICVCVFVLCCVKESVKKNKKKRKKNVFCKKGKNLGSNPWPVASHRHKHTPITICPRVLFIYSLQYLLYSPRVFQFSLFRLISFCLLNFRLFLNCTTFFYIFLRFVSTCRIFYKKF